MVDDLRVSRRLLWKDKAFTSTAALTLAVRIGANIAHGGPQGAQRSARGRALGDHWPRRTIVATRAGGRARRNAWRSKRFVYRYRPGSRGAPPVSGVSQILRFCRGADVLEFAIVPGRPARFYR